MDTVTFLGPRIPAEVKKFFPLLQKLKPEVILQILKLVVEYLLNDRDLAQEDLDSFCRETKVDPTSLSVAFTGLYYLTRGLVKSKQKIEVLDKELQQELRLPEFLVTELIKVTRRSQTEAAELAMLNISQRRSELHYPTLDEFRWRVDVCISSQSQSRVLRPTLLFRMKTSQGKTHQFEVTVEKFHELRYNVAKILKDMEEIEKAPILKIGQTTSASAASAKAKA